MSYLTTLEAVRPYVQSPDYYDEKQIEGTVTLREFLTGFLTHYPVWIRALYGVRALFVRLLGMRQPTLSLPPRLTPADIPFTPRAPATIFKVRDAQEELFWAASATDKHLTATVVIAVEPLGNGRNRFHVGSVVYYHHWTGPVYMNVIRPFHHIVVQSMMKAGVGYTSSHRAPTT